MDPEIMRQKAYCSMINGMPLGQAKAPKPKKKTKSKKKRAAPAPVKKKPDPKVTEAHNEPIGDSTKTQ